MTDTREQVARAIYNTVINRPGVRYDELGPRGKAYYGTLADAALAVAEPIIRAQVIEELAQKANDRAAYLYADNHGMGDEDRRETIQEANAMARAADWLRAQKDDGEPETKKIYIKG
jgi:hypothetical protein